MRPRSFGGLIVEFVAYGLLGGVLALARRARRAELAARPAAAPDLRFALPAKRRRRRVAEDDCPHCGGSGDCPRCRPAACRVCRGTGLQPRDPALLTRLEALWRRGTA